MFARAESFWRWRRVPDRVEEMGGAVQGGGPSLSRVACSTGVAVVGGVAAASGCREI